jgi:hypothetical protein
MAGEKNSLAFGLSFVLSTAYCIRFADAANSQNIGSLAPGSGFSTFLAGKVEAGHRRSIWLSLFFPVGEEKLSTIAGVVTA